MNSLYARSRKRILFLFALSILIIGGLANVATQIVNNYYSDELIEDENRKFVDLFKHTIEFESEGDAISYASHYTHINEVDIIILRNHEIIFESERVPEATKTYEFAYNDNTYQISLDNSRNSILVIKDRETYFINIISIVAILVLLVYVVISRRIRNKKVLYDISSIDELIKSNDDPKIDLNYIELQEIYNAFYNKIKTIDLMEEKRKDNLNGLVHDLKTPITILLNHLEDINSLEDLITNKDAVRKSLEELSNTSSDLISENFMGVKRDFNLSENLKNELETYVSTFKSKNITLKCNLLNDVHVKWNKRDFGRVLRNLLTNAYYYSNPDTTVYVNLMHSKETYSLKIINSGQVIKQQDLKRIFEKSVRDNQEDNVEGNGLGLYITKLLVEEIGATIFADSKGDENIFTIEFVK